MNLFYISTNHIYGGSEKLWIKSALELSSNHSITAFVHYKSSFLDELSSNGIQLILSNILEKNRFKSFLRSKLKGTLDLKLNLLKCKPDLVVINEGGVFSSLQEMTLCHHLGIPYIVLNGLVTEVHWSHVTNYNYLNYLTLYQSAKALYFVSDQNSLLFSRMLTPLKNIRVLKNPCFYNYTKIPSYPITDSYSIAYIGRIEFYHKGLDLLLGAIQDPKWKTRNIRFNFYGEGPHEAVLKMKLKELDLDFCVFQPANFNFDEIWAKNHIAIHTSRFEGKSLSITETMFNQRAIIMTNVGGVDELIEDGLNGFVVPYLTIESVAETLEFAWQARERWCEMGIQSRLKYDRISESSSLGKQIDDLIRNLN